jgi:hypothetical protein
MADMHTIFSDNLLMFTDKRTKKCKLQNRGQISLILYIYIIIYMNICIAVKNGVSVGFIIALLQI